MTLSTIFRFLCLLVCCFWTLSATGQSLAAKEIIHFDQTAFATELRHVQVFALDSRKLLKLAQENAIIHLELGPSHHWLLELSADPIFTPDYQPTIATEKGLQNGGSSQVQTFRGTIQGAATGTCRLTLAEGFIYGVFKYKDQTYFIEPARRLNRTFGEDQYLFYKSEDILPNASGRCAGAIFAEKPEISPDLEKAAGLCYTVQVAIAADYKMYQLFGETSLLEKYVAAILNSVRANYDDEFTHQIRFQISKLWISTCATCDPWGEDTNYENILAKFRDWGNEGGFNATYNVATLWTGRVLDDNIGGGGYYGALCGRLRYNVLRRYSENAGLMRALQAHELGHNLNARHDSTNAQTLMAPLIRDVKEWSSTSKVSINNYFNIAIGLQNCVGACAEPTAPVTDFFVLKSKGCAPLTVQFYNTSSANSTTWEWIFEGGNPVTSTEVNPLVTYTQPGFYQVTLKSSNAAGTTTITKTALIEIKKPPIPDFSIDYQMGTTTATFKTNMVADSIRWRWGSSNTSKNTSVTFDFQLDGTYPITLIAYNECGADTLTKILNIVTPPQAGFSAANVIGCAPLTVVFNNESSANAVEFTWQFAGGTPTTSTARNPAVIYEKPGVYGVTLVARNAAGEVTKRSSNLVQVNDLPSAGFSIKMEGDIVTFRNLSENSSLHYWDFGDGATADSTNPVHTYGSGGVFVVQLITKNDCGADTIRKTLEIGLTATNEPGWLAECKLYPNPNDGHFYLSLRGKPQARLLLRTVNALGQELQRQEVDFSNGKIVRYFDFSDLPNGVYWLEMEGGDGSIKRSFILQKT